MSLVATRTTLRHRCTIQRDANAATEDAYGSPSAPDWQDHLTDRPCRAWTNSGREPVDSDRTIVIVDRRVLLEPDTDVTERDRVLSVTHRGAELFEGPMGIEAVIRRPTHVELVLERIR